MPLSTLIIGAAGCGKTTRLLDTMERIAVDPLTVGFVSFTRSARSEAAQRAGDRFNVKPETLTSDGWFKTLHACCYKALAVSKGEMLADDIETRRWLRDAVQDDVSGTGEASSDGEREAEQRTPADAALHIWSVARSRLVPLETAYERAWRCDERTPDLEYCRATVDRYERAKRLDHRCDFTDLLGRFAGWSFQTAGHLSVTPQGVAPELHCWFIDEAQDNSALSDAVARRLTENSRYVYLVGDPWQAVYGFSGADPAHFQRWPTSDGKRHILAKSWRCPAAIVELGEACIRNCSDYWDRKVEPRGPGGRIESIQYGEPWPDDVDPRQSWLLLARTNFVARRLQQRMNAAGVPWVPIKGNGGWAAPKRMQALSGLLTLSRGGGCSSEEWTEILKHVPSKANGEELFTHGSKAAWEKREAPREVQFRSAENFADWGGTVALRRFLSTGRWVELVDRATEFKTAQERWGWEAVTAPRVRIGTVHAAKGTEADNVLVFTTASHQVAQSRLDQEGADEEARLSYVAVTRARERVIVARERTQYQMEIPA